MRDTPEIAVTGIGAFTAGGRGAPDVWQAVRERRTGLVRRPYAFDGEEVGSFFVHEAAPFNAESCGVDPAVIAEIREWKEGDEIADLYAFLAVVRMALDDAGLSGDGPGQDAGMVLAHENIGHDHFYAKLIDELSFAGTASAGRPRTKKAFFEAFYRKFRRTGYELQTFMCLYHLAKAFDLHGYSLMLNNACASGLFALEAAADAIRSGKCPRVIVSAVDRVSLFKQVWFAGIGMCAGDGRTKPFALDRDGFTLGDGGAALVLEDARLARERGARIYALYLGGGFSLEGWKVTLPDVSGTRYADAFGKALAAAAVDVSAVDLIVPHGVGTGVTDLYEARAIARVFGGRASHPAVTALKPYVGHALGASALLETALVLIGLAHGVVPATLYCERPDPKAGFAPLAADHDAGDIGVFMKTACGFAGYNAAAVFRRG